MLVGIVSVQLGAAIAKSVFGEVSPTTLVWLRLATAAVVLLALSRPKLRGRSRRDWLVVVAFGTCLALMNWSFYQSFARIPIGLAVTIEFLGPLSLAVIGSRRLRDLLWVGLAGLGVALLGVSKARLDLAGVLFGLLAGLLWAGYILLSRQTGRRWPGLSGLGVAVLVGSLVLLPAVALHSGPELLDRRVLLIGLAVGLLSSVIPYSFELIALRRLSPSVFGILMSLEPAAAALAAMIILRELLAPGQWLAVGCVVAASVGATRSSPAPAEPVPD